MNGFYLLLPLLAIRFGLLSIINKKAIQRAGYFAPVQGWEKISYYIYQLSNIVLFLYLFINYFIWLNVFLKNYQKILNKN